MIHHHDETSPRLVIPPNKSKYVLVYCPRRPSSLLPSDTAGAMMRVIFLVAWTAIAFKRRRKCGARRQHHNPCRSGQVWTRRQHHCCFRTQHGQNWRLIECCEWRRHRDDKWQRPHPYRQLGVRGCKRYFGVLVRHFEPGEQQNTAYTLEPRVGGTDADVATCRRGAFATRNTQ